MKNMIWTEEENSIRQMENLLNPKGKSCMNCQWSSAEKGEKITTCSYHLETFSTDSFCSYWTDPKDPEVIKAFTGSKEQILKRVKDFLDGYLKNQ